MMSRQDTVSSVESEEEEDTSPWLSLWQPYHPWFTAQVPRDHVPPLPSCPRGCPAPPTP